MKTALWMMNSKLPLAIERFDAIHYKLLCVNINNIDQLMKEICTGQVNISLKNIRELGFSRNSILKITIFAGEVKRISAASYTTPLQEVFRLNTSYDDNELDFINTTTETLQEVLLVVSVTMNKLFPVKWTNEVLSKFQKINVNSPDVLLRHITNDTLNTKLKANNHLSMKMTTLQVLA